MAEPELVEVDRHCSSDSESDNELVLVKKSNEKCDMELFWCKGG